MQQRYVLKLLFFFCVVSCFEHPSKSNVELYFENKGWNYPLHVENQSLKFTNEHSEDDIIAYDTLVLKNMKDGFLNQAVQYLETKFQIDTTTGYIIKNPVIYNISVDTIMYSIGIQKFISNYKGRMLPCEGCKAIENNTLFVGSNRAVFKINKTLDLEFKGWVD